MAALLRLARRLLQKGPPAPLRFPSTGFEVIDSSILLEEENLDDFKEGIYFPVNLGEVFDSKYQVVGKLGFGRSSTVWLARDLQRHSHVAMKFYTRDGISNNEFDIYKRVTEANPSHPGYSHVRTALDLITVRRPGGDHLCLIQKPMWDSFKDLLLRNPARRFTPELLKGGLVHILRALDYLHTECRLIHTDIKADNILQEIADPDILHAFERAELTHPSARKLVNGSVPVYASRRFDRPKRFGDAVLSDLGEAEEGGKERHHNAQPDVYRAPEVMLKADWSYPIDIWNVGCMIWDLFEGKHLFHGQDPDGEGYFTRIHLAEVIGMLGPPPKSLIDRGHRSSEFFDDQGQWRAAVDIPSTSLELSEERLVGEDKEMFLSFVRGMLKWVPEERKTASELLRDPWLYRFD